LKFAKKNVNLQDNLNYIGKMEPDREQKSKKYSKTKIIISLVNTVLTFIFLIILIISGISDKISSVAYSFSSSDYIAFLFYLGILGLIDMVISFPLSYYSGYYLEHKYELSNQTFFSWIWEGIKSFLVSVPISIPLMLAFLYLLRNNEEYWWLWLVIILFVFSILLARLAPILIMPLFYKFKPLGNESLENKISNLCKNVNVHVKGIFSFNLSKETKKANAGFTGIGKAKRIIISDTLLEKFSEDEIEVVFAHELGHYKYKHIWKGMLISTLVMCVGFYLVSIFFKILLPAFGYRYVYEIAALPILAILLSLYSLLIMPLSNIYSRSHERIADEYAVMITGKPDAFISTMDKLSEMNLSDKKPNPVIEFLFYSHPSTDNRIKNIKDKNDSRNN
jgi:STE24 endopeptidase